MVQLRVAARTTQLTKTGLGVLGDLRWGTHCCHFYRTQKELLETLVPYFKAGLERREFCFWLVPEPLTEAKAQRALRQHLPDSDRYLADGSIEIVSSRKWYLKRGKFSRERVARIWNEKLEQASARGYAGVRATGNAFWLHRKQWRRFDEYERTLNDSLAGKSMIVLCSYPLVVCGATEVLDVARNHHFAIAKRAGKWEVVQWRMPSSSAERYETLTSRERDVFHLAAEGHTNPEISQRLFIGVRTVEGYRANLMRKLGLRNQTDLVRYALQGGPLPIETQTRQTRGD
jgi:DNA-binding CsgD family transcriptional regulator